MIDISTIVKSINKETTIETELTLTSFESRLGDYPILKKQPISLHISNVENAAVHITGTVDIDIAIPCSRCLEEVPTNMHFDIDKTQMSICPKNKSSKGRRDKRRANWKMSAPTLVKCSKCGELMMPHRVCKNCGSYNKKEIIPQD